MLTLRGLKTTSKSTTVGVLISRERHVKEEERERCVLCRIKRKVDVYPPPLSVSVHHIRIMKTELAKQ